MNRLNRFRDLRGAAVAVASLFLIAGAALAGQGGHDQPSAPPDDNGSFSLFSSLQPEASSDPGDQGEDASQSEAESESESPEAEAESESPEADEADDAAESADEATESDAEHSSSAESPSSDDGSGGIDD